MLTLLTCTGDRPECLVMTRKIVERFFSKSDDVLWLIIDDGLVESRGVISGCTVNHKYVRRDRDLSGAIHTLPAQLRFAGQHVPHGSTVIMVEDDDYYKESWFKNCRRVFESDPDLDVYGEGQALYYNVSMPGYQLQRNSHHASMAASAFSWRAWDRLSRYCSKQCHDPCVDIWIWLDPSNADLKKKLYVPKNGAERSIIQFKGMPGRKSTLKAHTDFTGYTADSMAHVVKRRVHPDDYQFYDNVISAAVESRTHVPMVHNRLKLGVMFPASSREMKVADVMDVCRWYHRLGFDRIVFVNNGCMERVYELPFVEVHNDLRKGKQCEIMSYWVNQMRDCDWVLMCDSDEWLWPRTSKSIRDFLVSAPDECGAIAINWVTFGNKNQSRIGPCPTECIDRLPDDHPINRHVKCFVRPAAVVEFRDPHFPILLPTYGFCDERLLLFKGDDICRSTFPRGHFGKRNFSADLFCLAHFYARSVDEAITKERAPTMDRSPLRPAGQISIHFLSACSVVDTSFSAYWRSTMGLS